MGLRDDNKSECPSTCWSGYSISLPIRIYSTKGIVEIGVKTFHCLRRFSFFNKTPECSACEKDMGPDSFKIYPQYHKLPLALLCDHFRRRETSLSASVDILPHHVGFKDIESYVFQTENGVDGLTNEKKSATMDGQNLG